MHLLSYAPYVSSIKPGSIKGLANVAYGLTQSAVHTTYLLLRWSSNSYHLSYNASAPDHLKCFCSRKDFYLSLVRFLKSDIHIFDT